MSQLQEETTENVEQMMEHLSHLHDAPLPEVAVIALSISGMIRGQDFEYLSALAQGARAMSEKCLERLPSKMVLCGNIAPEEA